MSLNARVLLVDDDADLLEVYSAALRRAGYEVEVAYGGQEGLASARRWAPHVIVLDVVMDSATEGFDIVGRLKADPLTQGVPIIMVTSINRLLRPFHFGAHPDWLPVHCLLDKPVSPDGLVAEVGRLLSPDGNQPT